MNRFLAVILGVLWMVGGFAQSFPYNVSVQTVPGHCYDDAHLIFTLTDNNGNVIQIDPQTHNAVNIGQYPLYNVQYHYQNTSGELGMHYDYDHDIMLSAGTYCVGIVADIPAPGGGYTQVDTTFCNVQVTTSYQHLEASALFNLATGDYNNKEMSGWRPSFTCADLGRIQLHIVQGSFPYEVTILNEQQDTVRHTIFNSRVNNGNSTTYADYRDYYTFDHIPVGTYSIFVSDSCGYAIGPLSFTIPNAEPKSYASMVDKKYFFNCPSVSAIPFYISFYHTSEYNSSYSWYNYMHTYFDSILQYRFINPDNDATEWKAVVPSSSWYSSYFNSINDTLSNYCVIFDDTVTLQIRDLCHDTLMTYHFLFRPQFAFIDSVDMIHTWDTAVQDTCAVHLLSGVSTQTYKIGGGAFNPTGSTVGGWADHVQEVPFRYYMCPLSYNVWLMPDSILLGHSESNEFTGLGNWVSFSVDTTVQVHISVTDADGCIVAAKDTILEYHPTPLDDLLPWFECHNEIDDDGKDHCCEDRYLWIQEHGVDANAFRRNMTLRLIESPLFNHFNFTAIRQNGAWNVSFDDPTNQTSYVEFTYPDGWRATLRDSICLPPGRYKFEISTDCGVDTIVREWAGFYYDTHEFVSAPQYEIEQVCDHIVATIVSTGIEAYVYFIDPSVSNDVPIQQECSYSFVSTSSSGINPVKDSQGRNVYSFSVPGTYYITNYVYNSLSLSGIHTYYVDCIDYCYHYDTITVSFSYLDFETASALLCDQSSTTGIVSAQAVNGNAPYTYTLYSQWDASGNVIATNSTGFFDNVPMTVGQHFSVQVTDSCSTTFSVNITAALLTHGSLVWEEDANSGPHCAGDTVQLIAMNFPPPATYHWSGPNGFSSTSQTPNVVLPSYSENGWYTVEILNSDICGASVFDSILVPMAPNPQVTITGDSTVCPGGSGTLQANSSISGSSYVWSTGSTMQSATITPVLATTYTVTATSPAGCTGTASKTVTVEAPTPNSTHVFLCSDSSTSLTAREADTYLWSNGATTKTITVSAAGFYLVTATPSGGCSVVDTFKVTTVKVNGISSIHIPSICAGDTAAITVGHAASCNLNIVTHETILALNDTVFLPDGVDCPPYGCSYQSSLTFAGYEDTAHVNSVDDIRYLRVNMEHSFAGDLYINITCPNGQKADILKWGYHNLSYYSDCALQIPNSSKGWQADTGFNYNAAQSTFFGTPVKAADSEHKCDPNRPNNAFGTGWNYCWSNNISENYTYAPGLGSYIYREVNAKTNNSATPTYMGWPYYGYVYPKSFDSSNVANGTQFYHPDQSFDHLIGCPLNGSWFIEVFDGNPQDNGYIFGWELALAPDIQTIEYVDVVNTTVDGPWVTATSDSSFLFTPPANLAHDTTVTYTFHCHGQFGCGYDTVVHVTFYAHNAVTIDTTACDNIVWNGVTYTADTTFTESLTNIHGCDSTVTVNLHVLTTPTVIVTGPTFMCEDDTVTLSAVPSAEPQSYLWNNGATTPTITVSEPGVYTVTAFFAGGCNAESPDFHLLLSENPIIDAHLSDMVAGDTQTVVIGNTPNTNLQYANPQSTLTYSTVTFLPDGVPCEPQGCSYKATLSFSDFPDTAVIQSAEDIRYLRLNMEHSCIHDLYINLTCPNGRKADILKLFNSTSISTCLDSIPSSHRGWDNSVNSIPPAFEFPFKYTYMGWADWHQVLDTINTCDTSLPENQPGIGWNYCWSNSITEGYQYASGMKSLVYEVENIHLHSPYYVPAYIVDSSDILGGTNFYHPEDSFDSLIGCPVNGTWIIEVADGLHLNNGYIFTAELSVAEHLTSEHYAPVAQKDFDSLWVTRITDSTFIITPPNDLAHDTTVAYTFTLTDEYGCTFDTTLYITIYAHKHTDEYDTVFADELPHEWNGLTFHHVGCQDVTLQTVHGADSVITMHLSVIYPHDTAVCENKLPLMWRNHAFLNADSVTVPYPLDCADSIEILTLSVNPVFRDTAYLETCENELPFPWRGQQCSHAGFFYDPLIASTGCDSIYVLKLTVNPVYRDTTRHAICENEALYVWRENTYTEAGTYYDSLIASTGCDSIFVLQLTENQIFRDTILLSVCENNLPFLWHDHNYNSAGTYYDSLTSAVTGCDSIYVLQLTVNQVFRDTISQAVCENNLPFHWHNHDYNASGTYYDSLTSTVTGCDSIFVLQLTVNQVFRDTITQAVCDNQLPFHWHNHDYSAPGTYYDSLTSTVTGCDSIFVLQFAVNTVSRDTLDTAVCANDLPVLWHGTEYNTAGTHYDTLTSAITGCDSIFVLQLTVNEVFRDTAYYSLCEDSLPYFWRNKTCLAEGFYYDSLTAASTGCDSIYVLFLKANPSTSGTISITTTENNTPYLVNGEYFDSTGVYTQHLTNAAGCDSVLTINLTVLYNVQTALDSTICDSLLPLTWNGLVFTGPGTQDTIYQSFNGTDSVVAMTLTVLYATDTTIVDTIVQNNLPYTLNNIDYDTTGVYTQHLTNAVGCDSTITLHLQVLYNVHVNKYATICQNHLPAQWEEHVWTSAGTVIDTFLRADGTDSIVVKTLTVGIPTSSELIDSILENDLPYVLNDSSYYETGIYQQVEMNNAGCDSTITLHLTVFFNVQTELDSTICDNLLPFTWNGITFTSAGTKDTVLHTIHGADSVVTMTLHVNATSESTIVATVLENNLPYTLNGIAYDSSGIYTQTFTNTNNCDSTLTLELTVFYNVVTEMDTALCDSLLPLVWHGLTFTEAGTQDTVLHTVNGADSTVVMHLTVYHPTAETINLEVVENNTPYLLNGEYFDSTGTYMQHLSNVHGCDSLLTIFFTVLENVSATVDSTICDNLLPYTWNGVTFTEEGTQTTVILRPNGTDSVLTMTLHTIPAPNAHITGPTVLCADNFVTLTADSANAYLWSTGDTTQSIQVSELGTYSVTVSNEYGCADTASLQLIQNITVNPIDTIQFPDLCAGNSYPITVGHQYTANIVISSPVTTLSWADTVFLPDGVYCAPYGCSYQSPLTFTDFAPGTTVSSVNDILYVRINMEHSYAGDIYINITCPNGQKADIMKFDGLANSDCSSLIPQSSRDWQNGANASNATDFGIPISTSTSGIHACDPTYSSNAPGTGWNYCWSNNTTEGYTYAPGAGSLIYRSVNAHNNRFDSSNVAAGTKFYHPDQSFANLIGCPLNGSWYIEVLDGFSIDNGYLFGWELALAPHLVPNEYSDVSTVTVDGPWVTVVNDTTFIFSPPADLPNDTVVYYTFHLQDEHGCGYDTIVALNVFTQNLTTFDTTVCDSFVWNGNTLTTSGQYNHTFTNIHGCDSLVTLNLTVNHSIATHDTLVLLQNQLPYHFVPNDTTFGVNSPAEFQFSYTLHTQQNCDSVILQKVYVYSNVSQNFDTTVCASSLPFVWHGHTFTSSSSFTDNFQTVHGADSIITYSVTVDNPSVSIGNVSHILCYGDNTGAATATVTGGSGTIQYQWTSNGATVANTASISNRPAGTYTVSVTDALGCSATASVTLNVTHNLMTPGNITGPTTICHGDTIDIVMGTAATGDYECSYQWQISSDGTTWTPAPGTNNTQNYSFTESTTEGFSMRRAWISTSCGTLYSDTLTFSVWPTFRDTIFDEICQGYPYQENGFDISETETTGPGTLVSWAHYTSIHGCDSTIVLMLDIHLPQETTLDVEICEGDNYFENGFNILAAETVGKDSLVRTLNLLTSFDCDSIIQLNATIIDTALSIVSLTEDFCEAMSGELVAVSQMTDYVWNTGEEMPNITVTLPGTYYVTASQGNCSVTARYVIESCDIQLYLPNAITPSRGDGLNDAFHIPDMTQRMIYDFEISIFNRWGEQVFYSTDKNFTWNGEIKGKIFYNTVYNYIIRYTDANGKPYFVKGSITVL